MGDRDALRRRVRANDFRLAHTHVFIGPFSTPAREENECGERGRDPDAVCKSDLNPLYSPIECRVRTGEVNSVGALRDEQYIGNIGQHMLSERLIYCTVKHWKAILSCPSWICLVFVASCESKQALENACDVGNQQTCTAPDGCRGIRICLGNPATWGPCDCNDGAVPATDAGADASERSRLGASCRQDAECPPKAFCLDAVDTRLFGGAPPEGTCVADCSSDVAVCDQFMEAVCVGIDQSPAQADAQVSATAFCLESCTLGPVTDSKCHGRDVVACAPLVDSSNAEGFCRPVCSNDTQCPSGVCAADRGVCVASTTPDDTFGRRCDAITDAGSAADSEAGTEAAGCDGICLELDEATAVCSRRCVFGETVECAPASGGLRRGGCLFVTSGGSIGDLGYCAELCDCNDDCIEPSFVCDAFDDSALETAFARKGVCASSDLVTTRQLPCSQ